MSETEEPRGDSEAEDEKPRESEPWAKTSSGDADRVTED
jgi:hypothetical protein